jgi:hypothetical protein
MLKIIVGAKKRPAGAEELKWESLSAEELAGIASTPTLFGGARTFVLVGPLAAREDEFVDMADVFVESPHTFIFEEEKLLKGPTILLTKAGAKILEAKPPKKEYTFDQFGVAAALDKCDRKALWLALVQAFAAGEKAEAVAGLLAWKARAMGNAALSRQLTWMYHDSHRGAGDLELLLEKFALTL